ncbi:hypothetical protein EKQ45_15365 [Proteus vulgaris]|uniref:Type IV toxin-antitoxin system YeeU family antitoxin n=1 Tax=Proteus terrae subsp. cibarius TaxID=626774 RepID=A0A8I0WPC4_9GAMM|nr:type IV toxin-antitoxin system YeeU family antitoxin [Proteus terrae subsp. cibarius]QHP77239.1 hypothetical protein EKQ45_15365 [Proteus vulgaris]QUT03787.1 type IV toxin-antitoxin system YeeU family antitoxin [Proteus terrae subsp. cibarius]
MVLEGKRLHYLADRASIIGEFSNAEFLKLDEVFPRFISQMELMLTIGDIDPRHANGVALYQRSSALLSHSRKVIKTLSRYGFKPDGEVCFDAICFQRFRLFLDKSRII